MEAGQHSQVLYSIFPFGDTRQRSGRREPTGEVFDPLPVCAFGHRNIIAMQQNAPASIRKDFAGELFIAR
jgi:hypothetical protein